MSTKNLARAIIQGGRADSSKSIRRRTTRTERRRAKRYVAHALDAIEGATERIFTVDAHGVARIDEIRSDNPDIRVPAPRRTRTYPDFNDRLGPLNRWLDAHVGRSWEEVWHKLCLHDRSSTAGRHLVDDHARKSVGLWTDEHTSDRFVVDEDGTLCRESDFARAPRVSPRPWLRPDERDAWSRKRAVATVGDERFWRDGDALVPFTDEDEAVYQSLRGYDQRALRGYCRPFGKKRLSRELPWKANWRANRAAIGRPIDD